MSADPPDEGSLLSALGHTWRFRLAKSLLEAIDSKARLTPESLWSQACRLTRNRGLAMDASIAAPLRVLLESFERDAGLHALGRQTVRYLVLQQVTWTA